MKSSGTKESLNFHYQRREAQRIDLENVQFAKRLVNLNATVNPRKIEKDHSKLEKYQKSMRQSSSIDIKKQVKRQRERIDSVKVQADQSQASQEEFPLISKNMLSPLASGKDIDVANQSFSKQDPSHSPRSERPQVNSPFRH